jgi:type II pantothenate kinase
MAVFKLLSDASNYTADTWDLTSDNKGHEYWLKHFEDNIQVTIEAARQSLVTDTEVLDRAIEKVEREFRFQMKLLRAKADSGGSFTIFTLDRLRQDILNHNGLQDPFLKIKHQENVKACSQYPRLIKAHERLAADSLVRVLTEGIFAGNIFDLARSDSVQLYQLQGMDFYHALDDLPARPWLVDDYDAWRDYFLQNSEKLKRVFFFVDNAGCDFVLGCLPLARALAKRGATVILAVNDHPCLNDMTLSECKAVLRALVKDDELLDFLIRTRRLRLVGTGNGYPLIDLKQVSASCNKAAKGTDLLIIEGMGRVVESNWLAKFTCPTLKIAMLKDEWIAKQLGGKLYDLVCKFE